MFDYGIKMSLYSLQYYNLLIKPRTHVCLTCKKNMLENIHYSKKYLWEYDKNKFINITNTLRKCKPITYIYFKKMNERINKIRDIVNYLNTNNYNNSYEKFCISTTGLNKNEFKCIYNEIINTYKKEIINGYTKIPIEFENKWYIFNIKKKKKIIKHY